MGQGWLCLSYPYTAAVTYRPGSYFPCTAEWFKSSFRRALQQSTLVVLWLKAIFQQHALQCTASSISIVLQAKKTLHIFSRKEWRCAFYFSATLKRQSQSQCSHLWPITAAKPCQRCPLSFGLLWTFRVTVSGTRHLALGAICCGTSCCSSRHTFV